MSANTQRSGAVAGPARRGQDLVFEGVSLLFSGGIAALRDVDLSVPGGSFVSVVGTSGCGKSSLLNLAAGFFPPSGGRVLVGGAPVRGTDADRGMVFQEDAVFPWYTVLQNVEYPLRWSGVSRAERRRRAAELVERVGLGSRADALPGELSGGMRKRVDIARALASDPQVLLMDEPFGALDALTKVRLQQEFLAVWERQAPTVLFVTHDLEEALFLSDRVVVMAGQPGRIIRSLDVPFPRPRDQQLRNAPEFQRLRSELAAALVGPLDLEAVL